ncbi:hypothetical protein [Ktedonobacter sp. SOSP1-52]|uniref:hypothetical protein n=1 Tax=Ktedonobacter sp. SOSP1-52 TaxID=2778366 RepID=UPI001915E88D|nr:hypothetical protein [Ktedonobacter sp. SOSP1-52]
MQHTQRHWLRFTPLHPIWRGMTYTFRSRRGEQETPFTDHVVLSTFRQDGAMWPSRVLVGRGEE